MKNQYLAESKGQNRLSPRDKACHVASSDCDVDYSFSASF